MEDTHRNDLSVYDPLPLESRLSARFGLRLLVTAVTVCLALVAIAHTSIGHRRVEVRASDAVTRGKQHGSLEVMTAAATTTVPIQTSPADFERLQASLGAAVPIPAAVHANGRAQGPPAVLRPGPSGSKEFCVEDRFGGACLAEPTKGKDLRLLSLGSVSTSTEQTLTLLVPATVNELRLTIGHQTEILLPVTFPFSKGFDGLASFDAPTSTVVSVTAVDAKGGTVSVLIVHLGLPGQLMDETSPGIFSPHLS